jgi:hypothetical protein
MISSVINKTTEQKRLISLLEEWRFKYHGMKTTPTCDEKVYTREFDRSAPADLNIPKFTYPFILKESDVCIVPIYPAYHTELFPDSILRTESPKEFVENEPHRNALSKVYISRSHDKNLKSDDLIVFYRTGGTHAGVVTTIGIAESVVTDNIARCGNPHRFDRI